MWVAFEEMAGRGGLTVVTGPAGSGRTTVAVAWAREAVGAGQQVVFVSADGDRQVEPLVAAGVMVVDASQPGAAWERMVGSLTAGVTVVVDASAFGAVPATLALDGGATAGTVASRLKLLGELAARDVTVLACVPVLHAGWGFESEGGTAVPGDHRLRLTGVRDGQVWLEDADSGVTSSVPVPEPVAS